MILRNSQAGRDYDCNMFVAITLKSAAPLFIEVYVSSRENERSCICVLGVSSRKNERDVFVC